jgi:glycerophosphoryl diester phosphodiesterase
MALTRRTLALTLAAAGLAPGNLRAQTKSPLVIADQGSVGAPAASRAAFELAIAQGADFLGVELVATSDGALIARPANELSESTDVADHPEFAARRTTKIVDGASVAGWFTEDFTLAELKSLRCLGEVVGSKNRPTQGLADILTFQEVIDIARAGSVRTARVIGVWAGLRHPAYFGGIDLPLEPRVAEAVRFNGYNSPAAAMFVGASEPGALKALASLTKARLVQRLDKDTPPSDHPAEQNVDDTHLRRLAEIRSYANAISSDDDWTPTASRDAAAAKAGSLADDAHGAGLAVYPRVRLLAGDAANQRGLLRTLFLAGCDGVVCRATAEAVKARNDASNQLHRRTGAHPQT